METRLAEHAHLSGIHPIAHVVLHSLGLLLAEALHLHELLLHCRHVLVLGLRVRKGLGFEVDCIAEGVILCDVGLEQAVGGEKLHSRICALLGLDGLLPALLRLALLVAVVGEDGGLDGRALLAHHVDVLEIWVIHRECGRLARAVVGGTARDGEGTAHLCTHAVVSSGYLRVGEGRRVVRVGGERVRPVKGEAAHTGRDCVRVDDGGGPERAEGGREGGGQQKHCEGSGPSRTTFKRDPAFEEGFGRERDRASGRRLLGEVVLGGAGWIDK